LVGNRLTQLGSRLLPDWDGGNMGSGLLHN